MFDIICYPDPILRRIADPVEVIDDDLRRLAEAMIETMYANKGVGLAAPQIGVSRRLFIVDVDPDNRDPRVLINPVFVSRSKEKESEEEGCLSLPGLSARVTRPVEVTVRAQDLSGAIREYSGDGLLGRALQHESDHLDGVLFVDKVSMATKLSLRSELARLEEEYAAQTKGDA